MRARDNPFRTDRIGRLAFRHPTLPIDAIHACLLGLGRRAAIVGPHGSGKTTLLRELGARMEGDNYRVRRWFLNAQSPVPSTRTLVNEARTLGARDVLLVDGAGHLPRVAWWCVARACRRSGGLLVTTHAEGLLPTLVETRTSFDLLTELTEELTGASAQPLLPLLEELREAHRGNLRDVFLGLYDLAARGDPRLEPPRVRPDR